jgi:hypothetical protein
MLSLQKAIRLAKQPLEDLMQRAITEASDRRTAAIEANANKTAVYPSFAPFQAALTQETSTRSKLLENLMNRSAAICQTALEPFNLLTRNGLNASVIPARHAWDPSVSGLH